MFESQFIEIKLYNFCSINIFLEIQKPCEVYEKGLHDKKVTACAAMGIQGFIGPFPFEIDRATGTINSDRYAAVLGLFWRYLGKRSAKPFVKKSGSSKIG